MSRYGVRRARIKGEKERKKKKIMEGRDPDLGKQLVKERKAVLTTQHGQKFGTKPGDVKTALESAKQRSAEEAKGIKYRAQAPGFKPIEQVAQAPAPAPIQPLTQFPIQQQSMLPPSPMAAQPIVSPEGFAPGAVTPGITAEQPQMQETPAPKNFKRDVLIASTIGAATIAGGTIITTAGLSIPIVSKAASGYTLSKFGRIIRPPSPRTIEYLGYREVLRAPLNTKTAGKVVSWVTKLTATKKFAWGVAGFVSNAVMNGFLNEEADQNINHAIREAQKEGFLDEADELIEYRKELTDINMWNVLKWLIPFQGVFKYLDAARLQLEGQVRNQMKLRKMGEEGYVLTPEEEARREEKSEFYEELAIAKGTPSKEEKEKQKKRAEAERTAIHAGREGTEKKGTFSAAYEEASKKAEDWKGVRSATFGAMPIGGATRAAKAGWQAAKKAGIPRDFYEIMRTLKNTKRMAKKKAEKVADEMHDFLMENW